MTFIFFFSLKDSGTASSEDGDHHHKSHRLNHPGSGSPSPDICDKPGIGSVGGGYPLYHPAALHHYRPPIGSPIIDIKHTPGASTNSNLTNKPRIWSLADMAASKEDKDSNDPKQSPLSLYPSSHGKILSPLASRMPYPPYLKHDMTKTAEMYRSFNGPPTSHIPVGHPDYALLESYQRALVAHNGLAATMHHHPLSSIMAAKQAENNTAFAPLSLTTNHTTLIPSSGASPSTSSTSSRPDNTTPDHRQPPPPSEIVTP